MKRFIQIYLLLSVVFLSNSILFAEEAGASSAPKFGFAINLGSDVLQKPNGLPGDTLSYTRFGFKPDFALGKFGIGLDLTFRANLAFTKTSTLTDILYLPDWVPGNYGNGDVSFFDIYLPKFLYVRYGIRGADPLFAKLGSIDDLTLGTGFLMGNYANTLYLPSQRIFGTSVGLDGKLFNFPYVGMEAVIGNLAKFDVMGMRLFVRPLAGTGIPVIQELQVGGSFVTDTDPFAWSKPEDKDAAAEVSMYGFDAIQPILANPVISLAAFADVAFQPGERWGTMIGTGGKLASFITYGAQLRFLSAGFIPSYFDSNYDRFRAVKYTFVQNTQTGDAFAGWFASAGFSALEDKVVFNAAIDGPFKAQPTVPTLNQSDYPHLRGTFVIAEGFLAGVGLEAKYEKYLIKDLNDLIDPSNAVIGAKLSYKTGGAIISLIYDVKYNKDLTPDPYEITSTIQADVKF